MAQTLEIPQGFELLTDGTAPPESAAKPPVRSESATPQKLIVPPGFELLTQPDPGMVVESAQPKQQAKPEANLPKGLEPHPATLQPVQTVKPSGPTMGEFHETNPLKQLENTVGGIPIAPGVKKTFGDVGHEAYSIAANAAHRMWANPLGMTDREYGEVQQHINNYFDRHLKEDLETIGPDNGTWSRKLSIGTDRAGIDLAKWATNFGLGMTSPGQIALMFGTAGESGLVQGARAISPELVPVARTVAKLAQVKFTADIAQGASDSAIKSIEAAKKHDWEGMTVNAIEGLAQGVMARGIVDHEQATNRVQSDLEKTAREKYGDVQGGFTRPFQSKFDSLNPYQQAQVIDETVKRSPEYKAVLDDVEKQDTEAKERSKQQNKKKLEEYYSHAVSQAWNPDAVERSLYGLSRVEEARPRLQEEAIQENLKDIREEYEKQRKEALGQYFQERREQRTPRALEAARNRSEVGKVVASIGDARDRIWKEREESATAEAPSGVTRTVDSIRDDQGNILYPAQFWGEENTFGVSSDTAGHAIYRQTPRGIEWLTTNGNFSAEPDQVYFTPDPSHADTIAQLTALDANAASLAEAEGATDEQKREARDIGEIRRDLIAGDISAEQARRKAGIADGASAPDEYAAAREGKLNGPFHESSRAEWQAGLEAGLRDSGLGDEEIAQVIDHESLLARQQTQNNLNHLYRPGDYIVSRGGTKWTLDSKGMLHPEDGGAAVPLMKRGLYSNDAMQLAASGRVGYGTETRADRRLRQSRERKAAEEIRNRQAEVDREMRLAQQREGLQLASEADPRADIGEKETRKQGFLSRPPRAPESQIGQIVRTALQAPTDANSVINSIARQNDLSPEDVMRLALANDPERADTPEAKIAKLNVGDSISDPFRRDRPWVVEQSGNKLILRSGNATPLPLDRLNPSDRVKQLIGRGQVTSSSPEFTEEDIRRAAFEKPHYVKYQERLARDKEPLPDAVTERQAVQQAKAAEQKAVAAEAVATRAVVDLTEEPETTIEQAEGKAEAANEQIQDAEKAYAQQVTSEAKLLPSDPFPQRAPATIGFRGARGTISQNGREFSFHYELLPLSSLQTSHQWQGNRMVVNPEYPPELQPRTISDSEATQNALRAQRKSSLEDGRTIGYNFAEYADKTINGQMGPAIVDEGGRVVGGNTRIAIMRKHLDNIAASSDPELREAEQAGFRAAMRKLAQDSGIRSYPNENEPYVVVRMLDEPIQTTRQAAEMGRLFNKSVSVQITKSARGVSFAKSLDKPLLQDIARRIAGNDGLIPAMRADPEFFAKIVTDRFGIEPNEYADWGTEEPGRGLVLNEQGIQQFTKALMGTIIKDSALLNRIEGKTPYRALERAFGYLVQMQAIPDRDITGKIQEALQASAETMNTDPNLSRSRDKWLATYHPDQIQLAGLETELPPEPDRVVEAIWRALHASDAAVPRTFNDRMKAWIGEESPLAINMFEAERPTPSEAFNKVFSKELREVQHLRGDKHEGVTQEEFAAALGNRELSDVEREESRDREEGISPAKGGRGESPEQPVEGDKTPSAGTFRTAKGSTYELHGDGTTTRDKAYRPEHGEAEQGAQPRSHKTFYVTPEDAQKLGEFQTKGGASKRISVQGDKAGVQYLEGKDSGKIERRTHVSIQTKPKVGLIPVELWDDGKRAHFGNEITEVGESQKGLEPPPKASDEDSAIPVGGGNYQYRVIPSEDGKFRVQRDSGRIDGGWLEVPSNKIPQSAKDLISFIKKNYKTLDFTGDISELKRKLFSTRATLQKMSDADYRTGFTQFVADALEKEIANRESGKGSLPPKYAPKGLEPPPKAPSKEKQATRVLQVSKAVDGYVTPERLKDFLKTNPATKPYADELYRVAKMMAEYVAQDEGIETKDALDWVLRNRLAQIESSSLKGARGEYRDPEIEKGWADRVLLLHKAADASTFIHEFAHVIFPLLSDADIKALDTIEGPRGKGQWDGDRKSLTKDVYVSLSEKLANGLERFLREENPTGFTSEVKAVLAKVKEFMRQIYLRFTKDPLAEYELTDEARQVFADMFGITDFDIADRWKDEVKKARAEENRLKKPEEVQHPTVELAKKMGAISLSKSIDGKVEDTAGDRVDPRKPVAVMRFDSMEKAVEAWVDVGMEDSEIKNAELVQTPEGNWGIRFNTKTPLPNNSLFQEIPQRHPGLKLEEMQKRLAGLPANSPLRAVYEKIVDGLKNDIRARADAELEQPRPEVTVEEVKNARTDKVREGTNGKPKLQEPQRTGGLPKPPTGRSVPKNAKPARALDRPPARVPRSLAEVAPVALEPLKQVRGQAVGTTTGQAFDQQKWTDTLKRAGLPETLPPPTWALDPKTAQMLKFPGQKETVQTALSALEQGDGVVIANATGSGKTYVNTGIIKEWRNSYPDAKVLYITRNASLLRSAQRTAENTFGFNIERDAPEGDAEPGQTYGVTYSRLMRDRSYASKDWDLVVADEAGEARNWFQPDNKQGKVLIDVMNASKKGVYSSATPFHSPSEYGYLQKLNLWPKGGFDKWIENNFAHEKIGDKVVARLDPGKQAKLRQQLIERGQLVSQAISYEGFTAHFGVVPVTDEIKRGLDRIHEGFARAKDFLYKSKRPGLAEKVAAFEATYTKAYLERERLPQAVELARKARANGWQVAIFSETSSEDLFRRQPDEEPSTYQQLNEAMGNQLSKIIPPFEDVYARLKKEFGDEIGDYSGRGNSLAERESAKNDFLKGNTPIIYSTYAAGGIGVSLHDADFPELGVTGGDKPRIAIYLGPPYSGVLLEQAMGRFWRFGVKSDTHAVFLATDSEPDIRLLQTKVGPRMRALRAAVLGEKDSLANVMATYTDEDKIRERQDALAYQEGNEVRVDATSFQVRSRSRQVGVNDWSAINFPSAEAAKNRGMKFGEEIPGGDWTTLFQSKFEFGPPPDESREAGKKVINQIANQAVSGQQTAATEPVQNLDPPDRDMATEVSAADATTDIEQPDEDRDTENAAKQSMKASLKDNARIPYMGITTSQEQGIVNIARMDNKPEVGYKLRAMNRADRADRDVYVADKWTRIWDSLKKNGIKQTDAKAIEEITLVLEGKKTTNNPKIQAVADDLSDMMVEAHGDAANAGVRVYRSGGKDSEGISYGEFKANPKHFPHYIDWDRVITDRDGREITVRDLLNIDDRMRQRIIASIPELKPYSYDQVMRYLRGNDPRAPRQGHVSYTREINFPFIKRDLKSILSYFDEMATAIAHAKNFGPKEELLNNEIKKIDNPRGRNTLNSMFRASLHPQDWEGRMSQLYNWGVAYEAASKMTLSAVKVPFHLVLTPMALEGRIGPMMKAMGYVIKNPAVAIREAVYAGAVIRQTDAAEQLYGEHMNSPVRQILKKELFESSYKLVRTVSYHSARVYLDQYAMKDLKKGGSREQAARRLLRDVFTIGDHGIDQAIQNGEFSEEDVRRGAVAFTNYAAFSSTGDPLQMPQWARLESPMYDPLPAAALKKALRLTYALQSFSVKTASLLRERLYDEVVIHGNMRPLIYALWAFPVVGQTIKALGAGAKGIVHRGIERLEKKKHQRDSWDDYITYVSDVLKQPDAAKALKAYIDSWTDSAGMEMLKTFVDPLLNLADGKPAKSDQYWLDDAIQHLVGPFFSDVYEAGKEVEDLRKIQASKQPSRVKHRKEKESIEKFVEGQVPVVRQVPGFGPPPKPRR